MRIPMMAMTTSNSIKVNARLFEARHRAMESSFDNVEEDEKEASSQNGTTDRPHEWTAFLSPKTLTSVDD
jgi:hypothetical protein